LVTLDERWNLVLSLCDIPVDVELVQNTREKCLVEHRRQQGVGHAVPAHVRDQHSDPIAVGTQAVGHGNITPLARALDSGLEIVATLEIDEDEVVSPKRAPEGNGFAGDLYVPQAEVRGKGVDVRHDRAEIFHLALELVQSGLEIDGGRIHASLRCAVADRLRRAVPAAASTAHRMTLGRW
jgi:hypothetical protein